MQAIKLLFKYRKLDELVTSAVPKYQRRGRGGVAWRPRPDKSINEHDKGSACHNAGNAPTRLLHSDLKRTLSPALHYVPTYNTNTVGMYVTLFANINYVHE